MAVRIRMKTGSLILAAALAFSCVPARASSLADGTYPDFDAAVGELSEKRASLGLDAEDFEFNPEDLRSKVDGKAFDGYMDRDALMRRAEEDASSFYVPSSFDWEELSAARANLNDAFFEYLTVLTKRGDEVRAEVARVRNSINRKSEEKFGNSSGVGKSGGSEKASGSEKTEGAGKTEKPEKTASGKPVPDDPSSETGKSKSPEKADAATEDGKLPFEEETEPETDMLFETEIEDATARRRKSSEEETETEPEESVFETEIVGRETEDETEDSVDYGEVLDASEDALLCRGIEYEIRWAVVDGTLYFVIENDSPNETLSVRCDGIEVDGEKLPYLRLKTSVEPEKTAVAEFASDGDEDFAFSDDSEFKTEISVLLDAGDGDFTFEQFAATNAE